MYGVIELISHIGLDFYFVTIKIEDSTLILEDRSNGLKPLDRKIPLKELENVQLTNYFNLEEVYFTFEHEVYKFTEYGTGSVVEFADQLRNHLFEVDD